MLKFVVKVLGVFSGCFIYYFIWEQSSAWSCLESFVILWYPTVLSPLLSGQYISFSSPNSAGTFPNHCTFLISTECPSPLGRDVRPCTSCLTLTSEPLLHWGTFNSNPVSCLNKVVHVVTRLSTAQWGCLYKHNSATCWSSPSPNANEGNQATF